MFVTGFRKYLTKFFPFPVKTANLEIWVNYTYLINNIIWRFAIFVVYLNQETLELNLMMFNTIMN